MNNISNNNKSNISLHKKIFSDDDTNKDKEKNFYKKNENINKDDKNNYNNLNKSTLLNKNEKSSICFNISINTNKNKDNNSSMKKKYNNSNGQISSSQNKNESSNLNLYYNTSSHIKSKTNYIFGMIDFNKKCNLNSLGNFGKLREFSTNKTK